MFCSKCGQQLRDGAKFCTSCGNAVAAPAAPVEPVCDPEAAPEIIIEETPAREAEPRPAVSAQPVYQQSVMVPVQQQGSPAIPIVALIMGLLAMFFVWVPFLDFVFALLALVLGAVGLKKRLKGMAIAGLVIGIVFLIISIIWTTLACVGIAALSAEPFVYEIFEEAFREGFEQGLRGYY